RDRKSTHPISDARPSSIRSAERLPVAWRHCRSVERRDVAKGDEAECCTSPDDPEGKRRFAAERRQAGKSERYPVPRGRKRTREDSGEARRIAQAQREIGIEQPVRSHGERAAERQSRLRSGGQFEETQRSRPAT